MFLFLLCGHDDLQHILDVQVALLFLAILPKDHFAGQIPNAGDSADLLIRRKARVRHVDLKGQRFRLPANGCVVLAARHEVIHQHAARNRDHALRRNGLLDPCLCFGRDNAGITLVIEREVFRKCAPLYGNRRSAEHGQGAVLLRHRRIALQPGRQRHFFPAAYKPFQRNLYAEVELSIPLRRFRAGHGGHHLHLHPRFCIRHGHHCGKTRLCIPRAQLTFAVQIEHPAFHRALYGDAPGLRFRLLQLRHGLDGNQRHLPVAAAEHDGIFRLNLHASRPHQAFDGRLFSMQSACHIQTLLASTQPSSCRIYMAARQRLCALFNSQTVGNHCDKLAVGRLIVLHIKP